MLYLIFGPIFTPRNMLVGLFALAMISMFTWSHPRAAMDSIAPSISRAAAAEAFRAGRVSISFGGESYSLSVSDDPSVYGAMADLRRQGRISFRTERTASSGYVVKEINGKRNAGPYGWSLYVNGDRRGGWLSSIEIFGGDRIEWKYERVI